jgi:SAM-dependent methyltransferase/uncharacterized protein YbaR (Trm112 family)
MKAWALDYLRCPACWSGLRRLSVSSGPDGELHTGVLACTGTSCGVWYPVVRGVPRLISPGLRRALTEAFIEEHGAALCQWGLTMPNTLEDGDPLDALKQHTIANFGFEWLTYDRFGWDDPVYNLEYERGIFQRKTLLTPEDLFGATVLDAGCGNGRYTYWAAQGAARVFGVDLGDGVEAAHRNTRSLPNVQILQADLFAVPFAPATLDVIFSLGVLMHTGDAHRAMSGLAERLRPAGLLAVHLYGRGNLIYEWIDQTLRARTTRYSIPELQDFTVRVYRLRRWIERLRIARFVNRFVRIGPHPHIIFDWYAAPVATHHTYPEVFAWCRELGLQVLGSYADSQRAGGIRRAGRLLAGGQTAVTVKARRAG